MGTCWLDGECSDKLGRNLMSSAQCCGTIGSAWSADGVCTECNISLYDVDPCDNDICGTNMECVWSPSTREQACNCLDGFVLGYDGRNCYHTPDCDHVFADQPCGANAQCIERSDKSVYCECNEGYFLLPDGLNCEAEEVEEPEICGDSPCGANMECVYSYDGSQMCVCLEGRFPSPDGLNCEVPPGACLSEPCQNDGVCYQPDDWHPDYFECRCSDGYEGELCEILNPCLSDPCLNGGFCFFTFDTEAHFKCYCKNRFEGELCEIAPPECPHNQEWLDCGTLCPNKCGENVIKEWWCPRRCVEGCQCPRGWWMEEDGSCVEKPEQCAVWSNCPDTQVFRLYGDACPLECGTPWLYSVKCPSIHVTGCQCPFNWWQKEDGSCVERASQCVDGCPHNQMFDQCGTACPNICGQEERYHCLHEMCKWGCQCPRGWWLDEDGSCVESKYDCSTFVKPECSSNLVFNTCFYCENMCWRDEVTGEEKSWKNCIYDDCDARCTCPPELPYLDYDNNVCKATCGEE